MSGKLSDLTLRHVDPSRLTFENRHPQFRRERPEWFESTSAGGIRVAPWWRGTVLATIETKAEKDAYFVVVEVIGLYMTDEQAAAQEAEPSSELDDSTLTDASDEELKAFTHRIVYDLYPFLRAELYRLSSSMEGVSGVMLQPNPQINDDLSPRSEQA
jgi:hypothetical protein